MTRWARGQDEIEQSLANRDLQKITGAAANGEALLEKAARTLATAARMFGSGFRHFGVLRRRRNELEYPTIPGETATSQETDESIQTAQELLAGAEQLLPSLGLY